MTFDMHAILTYALQRELEGRDFFEGTATGMTHAAAASIFRRLADEERKHIELVQGMLDTLGATGEARIETTEIDKAISFFSERAQSENLDQTTMEAMVPDLPVLRMAYLIERDLREFYETVASKAHGDTKRTLKMLSDWERTHEMLFKEWHDRLFEEYAQMPWGG